MPTSRYQDKVLETYARSLLEAAKAENHVFEDLEMIELSLIHISEPTRH